MFRSLEKKRLFFNSYLVALVSCGKNVCLTLFNLLIAKQKLALVLLEFSFPGRTKLFFNSHLAAPVSRDQNWMNFTWCAKLHLALVHRDASFPGRARSFFNNKLTKFLFGINQQSLAIERCSPSMCKISLALVYLDVSFPRIVFQ